MHCSYSFIFFRSFSNISLSRHPCVIFAFGGGFARGTKADKEYLPYFKALTEAGYDVVSIDYRKHLAKGIDTKGLKGAVITMKNAVEYAAEDMLAATKVVLENAEKWNINDRDPRYSKTFGTALSQRKIITHE